MKKRSQENEHRNLLQAKSLNLEKIMNEKMSKRRIEIRDLQKEEIEEKRERRLLIKVHISYKILLINLCKEMKAYSRDLKFYNRKTIQKLWLR